MTGGENTPLARSRGSSRRDDGGMSYVRPDRRILRASDADRERAVDFLRRHAAEGRLDVDELGDRVGKALSAKTLGELDDLTYDLPVELPAAPVPAAPPPRRAVGALVAARLAIVYLTVFVALGVAHGARVFLLGMLLLAVVSMRSMRRMRRWGGGQPPRDREDGPPRLPF